MKNDDTTMVEFIKLRANLYAYIISNEKLTHNANCVTDSLESSTSENHYEYLFNNSIKTTKQHLIKSEKYYDFTVKQTELALSPYDAKKNNSFSTNTLPTLHTGLCPTYIIWLYTVFRCLDILIIFATTFNLANLNILATDYILVSLPIQHFNYAL